MSEKVSSSRFLLPALAFLVLIGMWFAISATGLVDPILLPGPIPVASALPTLFGEGGFGRDVVLTLRRTLVAISIAATVGIPLGLYFGYRKGVYAFVEGPIHALRSIPATALFPIFLILIGVGEQSIIALAMYPSLLVIIVNTAYSASLANRRRLQQAELLEMGTVSVLCELLFYEALPGIVDGLRTAISYSLVLIVAVEMFIGVDDAGLGRKIYLYQTAFRIPETYAAIIVTGVLGIAMNQVLTLIERRLTTWIPHSTTRHTS